MVGVPPPTKRGRGKQYSAFKHDRAVDDPALETEMTPLFETAVANMTRLSPLGRTGGAQLARHKRADQDQLLSVVGAGQPEGLAPS
jgi:hypothetical protein